MNGRDLDGKALNGKELSDRDLSDRDLNNSQLECDQLVRGRWVFTNNGVLADGAVALNNDTIVEVGAWERLRDLYPDVPVLGSPDHAVLPGFINAHHHSNGVPNSLLGIEDDFLELWLYARGAARPQNTYLRTLLSAALLLKSGVTTVVDVSSMGGSADESHEVLQQQIKAYEDAGIRVAIAPGARYDSFLVHGENQDDAFLATLPDSLRQQVNTLTPPSQGLSSADYLEIVTGAVKQCQSHEHIDIWFGPPGPQWVGDALLVDIVEAAIRLNTNVQTHVMESLPEKLMGPRFYNKSVIAHLKDLGVLSPAFSMAHGVWVGEDDIEILAETGAAISHNPSSNLRLRAGIAPLMHLLDGGVTVGLGMDGTTLNDDEDMFTEMRLAGRLARSPRMDSPAPSFADLFNVATSGGAKLLGKAGSIGKLAPGYKADLSLVRCDCLAWPYLAPDADPLTVVMMRAKSTDVDTVLVNGRVVLKAGQPTGFDWPAIGEAMASQLQAMPDRTTY
ncbi:MAG: amidohydrolase family protein, partial [Cyanobacteria bacterium J06598_3]